jgi:hypothetical protein
METCTPLDLGGHSPGRPVFGDYNGSACARGAFFMAWATATPPHGACTLNGLSCNAPGDCCSNHCFPDAATGVGPLRCAPAGLCAGKGEACASNNDCCSRTCQGGQCFAAVGIYASTTACEPHQILGGDNACHACAANAINVLNSCQACRLGSTADPTQDRCACVPPTISDGSGNCQCFPGSDQVPGEDTCACRPHWAPNPAGCTSCEPDGIARLKEDGSGEWECHLCPDGEAPVAGENRCESTTPPRVNECADAGSFCLIEGDCVCNHNDPSRPICRCVSPIECEGGKNCCPNPFESPPPDPAACAP